MTNPDTYPLLARVILYRRGTAGVINYKEDNDSKLIDWELELNENHPKKFTLRIDNRDHTSTVNLLSSSCAVWSDSVIGALLLGDYVRFGLYQRGTATVDYHFKGVITEIKQGQDGVLSVTAYDFSKRLEYIKRSFVYYKSHRDSELCDVDTYSPIKLVVPSDSDVQVPMASVQYAGADGEVIQHFGNGTGTSAYELADDVTKKVGQPFIAEGRTIIIIRVRVNATNYSTYSLRLTIQTDSGSKPSGNIIYTKDWVITDGAGVQYLAYPLEDAPLLKGSRYWLVFQCLSAPGGGATLTVDSEQYGSTDEGEYQSYNGSAWSVVTSEQLNIEMNSFDYSEQDVGSYYYDAASNRMEIYSTGKGYGTFVGNNERGLLSYYYGTRTLEEIVLKLIKQNTGLLGNVSSNLDRTFKTYYTKGKSIADCLRECLDLYETSGTWLGKQHVMGHYTDGSSIERLKVGKRLNVTDDAETEILSFPPDRAAYGDEHVIIGDPELRQSTKAKYSQVMVIGKDANDNPLIAFRSDRGKSDSFYDKMSGLVDTLKVTNDNLRDQTQVSDEAIRLMDAIVRDVWEGAIRLSGQHLCLWDTDTTSDSYGSGKIIKLYWSPLGISALKMKVTSLLLRKNSTEIYVNNTDPLLDNVISRTMGTTEKLDSFAAPIGTADTVFLEAYDSTVVTDASLYMELEDEDGTDLKNMSRVLCSKYSSSTYNSNTYHAEFEKQNGYSAKQVRYIKLYTALTGGSLRTTIDLQRTVSSIDIDEKIDKFKTNRIIVESTCKAS